MKNKLKSLLLSASLLAGSNVQAYLSLGERELTLEESPSYSSLLGSEWALKNPELLPFSKCRFVNKSGEEGLDLGSLALGFGKGVFDPTAIECVSKKYHLYYYLPLSLGNQYYLGLGGAETINLGGDTWISLSGSALNGKTIGDLTGTYIGGGAGLTLFLGGTAYKFTNLSGASMVMKSMHGFTFDFRLGPAFQSVKEMQDATRFFSSYKLATSVLKTSTTGTPSDPIEGLILSRNLSGNLVLKLGENTVEDEISCYKLKDPNDPNSVCGRSSYKATTTLPAGTEAVWNGNEFEVSYRIQGTDQQSKKAIPSYNKYFQAIDGSTIYFVKAGEKMEIYSKKDGNTILTREDGSIVVSDKDEKVDFEKIKGFRFVWDGIQE